MASKFLRLRPPRTIACLGRNYAAHIKELNNAPPAEPFYFLKPPAAFLPPNSGPILCPPRANLHYEVELAAIIAQPASNVPRGRAREYIKGYCVAIDMTARNYQDVAKKSGLPWTLSKGFDTFCPVSHFVPKEVVEQEGAREGVELWLRVNGEDRQRDLTSLMLVPTEDVVEFITGVARLDEDDLVLTGTPKGVGPVKEGDVITAGLRVNGREVQEGGIEVAVEKRVAGYGVARG